MIKQLNYVQTGADIWLGTNILACSRQINSICYIIIQANLYLNFTIYNASLEYVAAQSIANL